MNGDVLEKYYKESLEERIIAHLAKVKNLTLEQGMDIYYSSHLAHKIHERMMCSIWIIRYWCRFFWIQNRNCLYKLIESEFKAIKKSGLR